jgi:hypothetical protein
LLETKKATVEATTPKDSTVVKKAPADAATMLAKKQVPVLCYHHIKDFTGRESTVTKDYIVPIANFKNK